MKRLLTIAGSDSGGGAGIQADLKTFAALGCYGMSVITACTAQNTLGITNVMAMPVSFIVEQLGAVLQDIGADAIKIGMLFSEEILEAIVPFLKGPVVLDPVMFAKRGERLFQGDFSKLAEKVTLITPNLEEASALVGYEVKNEEQMEKAVREIGFKSVLIKGLGNDVLYHQRQIMWFRSKKIETQNTHGSGCTLSSAISVFLAEGMNLTKAVSEAKRYHNSALQRARPIGKGYGPLHHFHKLKIAIIGGGIIGLSTGWQLLKKGHDVHLFERQKVGSQTSYAAAGMLSLYSEPELQSLYEEGLNFYPSFLKELREDVQEKIDLQGPGTLYLSLDQNDTALLRRKLKKGVWLSQEEVLEKEPLISPKVQGGFFVEEEKQIDNRRLLTLLVKAFLKCGGNLYEECKIKKEELYFFDRIIEAIGSASDKTWPNKGQILTLKMHPFNIQHVVQTPRIYLVPKGDGTLRVGATSEDVGFDRSIKAGALLELLKGGYEILPAIEEMDFQEVISAFRPATEDRHPIIGPTDIPGHYVATGHGRAGILLAPYTAYKIGEMIDEHLS